MVLNGRSHGNNHDLRTLVHATQFKGFDPEYSSGHPRRGSVRAGTVEMVVTNTDREVAEEWRRARSAFLASNAKDAIAVLNERAATVNSTGDRPEYHPTGPVAERREP